MHSFTLPAVKQNAVIVPWESHTTWSFEPKPPPAASQGVVAGLARGPGFFPSPRLRP